MKKELWKDIDGYEGLYQVSNLGRIKSLRYGKERIMKPGKHPDGYFVVTLSQNNKKNYHKVHRLVAQMFLENPYNLPQVNHKNENKADNRVENLEWCSAKYNSNYGTRTQRMSEKKVNGKLAKTVYQYTLDGEFIKEYPSTMEIQRLLNFRNGNISECCNGRRKSAYGFIWKYSLY